MKLFTKEKAGTRRIINICGLRFEYNTAQKYNYIPVNESGLIQTQRKTKLIVSLTSFPERIPTLHICLSSLLQQTVKPDMLVLWLAKEQFPNLEADLPEEILRLKQFGLTIRWWHDVKPYKKLVPILPEHPEDIIVTTDDDVFYDKEWLERLYTSYLEFPQHIHCHRTTKILLKNGRLKGRYEQNYKFPSFANKLSGGGGVLYPPHSLYKDITNEKLFMELAPTNDDIWFWMMAVLNNTKIMAVKNNIKYPILIEETLNGPCLCQINDHGENLFDIQLENVLNHYPGLREKIIADMG